MPRITGAAWKRQSGKCLRNAVKQQNQRLPKLGSRIAARVAKAWLDRQPAEFVWLTGITLFEARLGLALLPTGRRRQTVDFDSTAAAEAASLGVERQKAGRSVDMRDTQIAGIALARRATLATRNGRHFSDLNVPIVDPWATQDV